MKINLNADMGESWGPYTIGNDAALLGIVGAANIACGAHGGDAHVMLDTVRLARGNRVSIGAHPGYADLHGFGRRAMTLPSDELRGLILTQIGALIAVGRAEGHPVTHVKPHGAMNNQACADRAMADVIAQAVADVDPGLILLAPALSELAAAGRAAGLVVALEAFADRAYQPDGQLAPRGTPGAVLHDPDQAAAHVLRMVTGGGLVTTGGDLLPTPIHSICVHGDGPTALVIAAAVRDGLAGAGYDLTTLPKVV
ncbi:MAG: 5-oxoprolinase subunit PxpA [Paracoccus sp. (in: a-proteobacteria)]|uniref:LamB/YcsF family protein n=1 Tax=Paracoccus sp. TaxID=267 RepID=UPI0026E0EB54|nr:5-oxoprolinase subunit PxpA [Paracoccus sp. (in: a-proteobacteria)]MDO5620986.1 5-oxoprolinase subunit PxpA [Paracoccus sp. (in: a-proteobacteria)]